MAMGKINVDVSLRKLDIEIGIEDFDDAIKVLKEIGTATGLPLRIDTVGIGLPVFQTLRETGVEVEGYNPAMKPMRGNE